jgi:hypothetical protein
MKIRRSDLLLLGISMDLLITIYMNIQLLKARLRLLSIACAILLPFNNSAQQKNTYAPGKGPNDFPQLIFKDIPGAPKLSPPKLITGSLEPVIGEGNGWAAPFVYDWNGDGKKDLLVGEFSSGAENRKGGAFGNFVRVYTNKGTDEKPSFTGGFTYARANDELKPTTPLSVYTWCCIGFTPRIVDLNKDGYPDLITGQFEPGDATWFRGSETGFHTGEKLEQVDVARRKQRYNQTDYTKPITDPTGHEYWSYSAMAFGDLDGDGLDDMVIGGGGLRMSKNIGTAAHPKFGPRELLLDRNDKPVYVYADSTNQLPLAVPYVVDWDGDQVLDLLVTCNYYLQGSPAVSFFRGVKTEKGIRFEHGVPLFSVESGAKAFPGAYLNLCVADWNNDGVNDLIIGSRVPTIDGKFQHQLAYGWNSETDLGKRNPGNHSLELKEFIKKNSKAMDSIQRKLGLTDEQMIKNGKTTSKEIFKHNYGKKEYMNLVHKGYVYVLLGKKEN